MAPLYYRGAVAAILVFAVTDESSFDKLKDWVRELQSNIDEPLVLAIACNKADLAEQRAVSFETAAQYAAIYRRARVRDEREEQHRRGRALNEVARRLVVTRARATETGQPQLPDPLQDAPNQDVAENVLRVTQVYSGSPSQLVVRSLRSEGCTSDLVSSDSIVLVVN